MASPAQDQPFVLPQVESFLAAGPKLLYIGGQWRTPASGDYFEVVNPNTGKVIGSAAAGGAVDVDSAARAARAAFENPVWAGMNPHLRSRLLLKIANVIEQNLEELSQIESLNNGMPLAVARQAIGGAAETFIYYAGWATKIYGETNPSSPNMLNYTLRQPVGVCGLIVPWNGPLSNVAWKIAPALAAGNTVIVKPAEQTPFTAVRFAELLDELDLPPGVFNVVTGLGDAAGAAITVHPGIDKVAFTGSTAVGKKIMAAAAGNMKRLTLELGGKSPNIIFADADLETAAIGAMMGFCFLSGQVCVAGTRILVQDSIHDAFAEKLTALVEKFVVGDPFDPATDMGPVVSATQMARVNEYVEIGRAEGANLLTGGGGLDRPGYFIRPTIFGGVNGSMRIAREEIFGPVAVLMPFHHEADAISKANDSEFGLAAAVWTRDVATAHRCARALNAGTVWVNTYHHLDLLSPFGGFKQSGIGRELGRQSLDAYTEVKSVFVNLG